MDSGGVVEVKDAHLAKREYWDSIVPNHLRKSFVRKHLRSQDRNREHKPKEIGYVTCWKQGSYDAAPAFGRNSGQMKVVASDVTPMGVSPGKEEFWKRTCSISPHRQNVSPTFT